MKSTPKDVGSPRIVTGVINENGSVARGSGFTAVKTAVGDYTVTFNTAFVAGHEPVVTFSVAHGTAWQLLIKHGNAVLPSISSFRAIVFNANTGSNTDGSFSFHAIES